MKNQACLRSQVGILNLGEERIFGPFRVAPFEGEGVSTGKCVRNQDLCKK